MVSPSGDIYFTDPATGQLYLRRDAAGPGATTEHVSASRKTEGGGPGRRRHKLPAAGELPRRDPRRVKGLLHEHRGAHQRRQHRARTVFDARPSAAQTAMAAVCNRASSRRRRNGQRSTPATSTGATLPPARSAARKSTAAIPTRASSPVSKTLKGSPSTPVTSTGPKLATTKKGTARSAAQHLPVAASKRNSSPAPAIRMASRSTPNTSTGPTAPQQHRPRHDRGSEPRTILSLRRKPLGDRCQRDRHLRDSEQPIHLPNRVHSSAVNGVKLASLGEHIEARGLAIDSNHVYWSDIGNGRIGRSQTRFQQCRPQIHHFRP